MFNGLDHIAIVVRDTEEALKLYRDVLGLPLVLSEVMADSNVRLTHLDMGNTHLQLVEPLTEDHPLTDFLNEHGEALHHLCFKTDDVEQVISALPAQGLAPRASEPHSGPRGKQAGFIDPATTHGILFEFTGKPPKTN